MGVEESWLSGARGFNMAIEGYRPLQKIPSVVSLYGIEHETENRFAGVQQFLA